MGGNVESTLCPGVPGVYTPNVALITRAQVMTDRIADALTRLGLILATATLYLVSTGTAIVSLGLRHLVDTHWQRGLSYFQIG